MKGFLSCDWGTSAFRLRLVSLPDLAVLEEEQTNHGIKSCYEEWAKTKESNKQARIFFYSDILNKQILQLKNRLKQSIDGLPIVISGMASSSIGIVELPYADTPFNSSGSSAITHFLKATSNLSHDILLISGLRAGNDVLRGEETQWLGCMDEWNEPLKQGLYILPGTHSKHLEIADDKIVGFKTYMTGEVFDLLASKSILQSALLAPTNWEVDTDVFVAGVKESMTNDLLHTAFKVRTNDLFHTYSKEKNYHYLSGLIIGAEVKNIKRDTGLQLSLCAGTSLSRLYQVALKEYGWDKKLKIFPPKEFDNTVIKGQYKILMQQKEMIR